MFLIFNKFVEVSTATTATMIMLTSSSVAIGGVVSSMITWDYFLGYFLIAFTGAFVGKLKIDRLVKKYDRTSLLIFILASIIAFATIMVTIAGLVRYSTTTPAWAFEGFTSACGQ
jgi:uncharacterized membrane protein YfcA